MATFDDALLEHFANQHYGYGDFQGDVWFVGMEEGGGELAGDAADAG